ncbi:MAG: hypothetical protein HYZ14_06435 [Bacteroidetes bacterium]|nr:hypothetical protein [Bacteroidota bacterium]
MKNTLLLILFLVSISGLSQNEVKCGDAISVSKGTLADTSSVSPRMKLESVTSLVVGATGELALLTEDGNFRMTYSIGKVKVIAVENQQLTFQVIEKLGVITINGVERSNFKTDALVQFTEYKYDKPALIETKWPSGAVKESGYMLCDQKMGEWKEYHENGAAKTSYRTDKNGSIEGVYTEYHANGTKAVQGEYRYGKKTGLWTEYYDNGEINAQGYYYDGKKSGKWIEHDASGKKVKRKYDAG